MFLVRQYSELKNVLSHFPRGSKVAFTVPPRGLPILVHLEGADDVLLDHLAERAIEAWTSAAKE